MIKRILQNLSISDKQKDDSYNHIENISDLIEGILLHEDSHKKYVNILNELTTLCYENPLNFRKLLFAKKDNTETKKRKVEQIVDKILIVLEKYEETRNIFLYSITKLILINDFNFNIHILRILCQLIENEEYKFFIYDVFEELLTPIILNSTEKDTLNNIIKGLCHLPKDELITRCFNNSIHKFIALLREDFNTDVFTILAVLTTDRENCLIAYDEGLIKIVIRDIEKYQNLEFSELPSHFLNVCIIASQLCSNYFKHCDLLIKEKLHLNFFFKNIKNILNINGKTKEISKTKAFFCSILLDTLNSICKFHQVCLFELCNSYFYIDLLLMCIKEELCNPYVLSLCLKSLLLILRNEELYKNNIEYILKNMDNFNILLPFLFGYKYNNIFSLYSTTDNEIEVYLVDIIKSVLDITVFFFQHELDQFTFRVKKEFRDADLNYLLLQCFEKKNDEIIIRILKCIYYIPFCDYKNIDVHKIFFILNNRDIVCNEKSKEIYYYCIKIYIKVLKCEEIKRIIEEYKFKEVVVNILYIMNQFLIQMIEIQKKNKYMFTHKSRIEEEIEERKERKEEEININKITVEFLCIASRYTELRPFMRNDSTTFYFLEILSNENNLLNELNMEYDTFIERTWCCNIENIFRILMKKKLNKKQKVCLRLLICIADIFNSTFYSFHNCSGTNIFQLCNSEAKKWKRKTILKNFYLMNTVDYEDYKKQTCIFIKEYISDMFSFLNTFIQSNIFNRLKEELKEQYFPGVLKYHILKYEQKFHIWKKKEKQAKLKATTGNIKQTDKKKSFDLLPEGQIPSQINSFNDKELNEKLEKIKEEKKKLYIKLENNHFTESFDMFIENEISSNITLIFGPPKVVKKKKELKQLDTFYRKKLSKDNTHIDKRNDDLNEQPNQKEYGTLHLDIGEKKSEFTERQNDLANQEEDEVKTEESRTNEETNTIEKDSSFSSSSELMEDDPNESILDKMASLLLGVDKESIFETKNNFNIFLFNKRGICVNSNKGEVNETYVLYAVLRIFYSLLVNNINTEIYVKVKEYLIKENVLKMLINFLNQCSFYDGYVYPHFFRLYSEIFKNNLTSVESMNRLIFYNIITYYCKVLSKEFIKRIKNNEYVVSYCEQYFFSEITKFFYYLIQKIIYIQFSQYKNIQKWAVDSSLFHFFYKNNILFLLYLFIYIHNIQYGSRYASYIYHKKYFYYIQVIFFYTLFSLSYLMFFSKKLKYFIIYFINYKKHMHKVLFRKSIIHSLFLYHKLIFLRILFQNQLSVQKKKPTQILHLSPVLYVQKNETNWYFLALGLTSYYILYIPDDFEENITEKKNVMLQIFSEEKYCDLTRISVSKLNDNFFVFGKLYFDKQLSFEKYDMFICLNKYFRDEIISYAQYLSGSNFETKVDLFQDTILANNLKNYMNVNNILITSFAYEEITPKEEKKRKERKGRKKEKEEERKKEDANSFSTDSLSSSGQDDTMFSSESDISDDREDSKDTENVENESEQYDIFRTNNKKNKRKLLLFVLTKNHIYIFKCRFKYWLFLSPFSQEEKEDIFLYVESSLDSDAGKTKMLLNEKIYLNNFLGLTVGTIDRENISFVRNCAIRNTMKYINRSNNTDCTNEEIISTVNESTNESTSKSTTIYSTLHEEKKTNTDTNTNTNTSIDEVEKRNVEKQDEYNEQRKREIANKCFLQIQNKYNIEQLCKLQFQNSCEPIVSLLFKIYKSEDYFRQKNIKIVLFDDYTRELWKRYIAQVLNVLITSSEWKRKWQPSDKK